MKVKLPERRAVSAPGRQDGGAPAAAPLKTRGGKTARRVLRRIGYIAACCCCVGVMLASVAAVVFASYLARLSGTDADMPDLYVLKMAENSIVYAADPAGGDWTEYAVFTGENDRVWTPLEQFPQTLRDAVVSVEDRNFWNQRFGINPGRILGAAVNELTGHRLYGSRQGASTLEQQLIENLTGDSAQSISGKFKEISRAIVMAGRYSKDMILEAYLNIAPLTGTLSGMQAGAQQYFGKDASQLTLAESATLASIPRSPVAYSPYSNPEKLLERRNWVLKLMLDQERISQADYDAAAAAPLGVRSREEAAAASPRGKVNSYFTDAVFEQLADDIMEKENCGRAAAVTRIRTGGLRIFSTVDLRLQRMLEAFMENDGEDGYFPEAFINMLALLGWNPGTEQELFSMQELIDNFSLERVSKSGARFQPDKAKWFNAQYMHRKTDAELAAVCQPILREHGIEVPDEAAGRAAGIMKERAQLITDLWDLISYFFVAPAEYEEKQARKYWKGQNPAILAELRGVLAGIDDFSKENTERIVHGWIDEKGYGMGQVMNTLRLALVGAGKGPGMYDVTEFIGREECLRRIDRLLKNLKPAE